MGTRWPLVPLSFPLFCSPERAGAQGHGCVCPETRLLSWQSTRDKDPSSPGGCRNSRGLCGSLAAKVREGYDTSCILRIHTCTYTRTHAQPTEQPVFRAPQDNCFDSQGEKIVIERTSDTCVVISWRGATGHTHTRLRARSMSSQWINV